MEKDFAKDGQTSKEWNLTVLNDLSKFLAKPKNVHSSNSNKAYQMK